MKRTLLALALLSAIATQASAVLNFNLTTNSGTVTAGDPTGYTLYGTIVGVNLDLTLAGTTFASPGGITITPTQDFVDYLNDNLTGVAGNYTGSIAVVAAPASTPNGLYDGYGAFVTVGSGDNTPSDNEFYEVNVVPEPSAFAALGLGAVALIRRRRRA